jgi:hypothetical protein
MDFGRARLVPDSFEPDHISMAFEQRRQDAIVGAVRIVGNAGEQVDAWEADHWAIAFDEMTVATATMTAALGHRNLPRR